VKAVDTISYEKLALFYDLLMQGIDYEAWVSYVEELICHFQGSAQSVADLACGTGNSTIPWSKRGYSTIGIDLSAEMLEIARRKSAVQGYAIEFQQGDLRSFELADQVDLAVCFQDGFNYILDSKDLAAAFQSVFNNLHQEGFFIFDLNYLPRLMPEKDEIYTAEEEEYALTWRTRYMEKEQLWEIKITGKIIGDGEDEHFSETHREKIYESEDVWLLLTELGFTVLGTYQAFTFSPPHEGTPRVVYVAQKSIPEK
jgi:ubiquinone/menaquinone biosynthesis C-methylase UbiE